MKDSCHAVLKQYAAFHGWTMSDVVYEASRHLIHSHAASDPRIKALLDMHGKALDPRIDRDCYGSDCLTCGMYEDCCDGDYLGSAPHLTHGDGD